VAEDTKIDKKTGLSLRQRLDYQIQQMKNERATWDQHWRSIADAVQPRRARFTTSDRNKGTRMNQTIINGTAGMALRTLRAGMMSGLSSPSRPWFRLTMPDPDLTEFGPVKAWLNTMTQRMATVLLRTNFYRVVPQVYGAEGLFGTAAMLATPDPDRLLRFHAFPIGSFMIATDSRCVVNTFAREFQLTVLQLVEQFGIENVGDSIRNMYERSDYHTAVDVSHIITPNSEKNDEYADARGAKFKMCYYEKGGSDGRFLEERGTDIFPVMAPRWDTVGEDIYGSECPGMEALGDVRALQVLEKRKAQAIEKTVNPPLTAPTSLRTDVVSALPGNVTYVDVRDGQGGVRSLYDVRFPVGDVINDIAAHQTRIDEAFYKNLFLMIASANDSTERTAREIAERHEEKLLALGPTLEGQSDELHDPVIDIVFAAMLRRPGMVPPPPQEIQGEALKVEYISIMAQAQKMVASRGLENFFMFAGAVATLKPEVLDKIDADVALEDAADMAGVNPEIIVPDKVVAQIRAARAQKQAAMEMAAAAPNIAGAAKDLSEVKPGGNNALTSVMGALTG
jgi:hypothetical protein